MKIRTNQVSKALFCFTLGTFLCSCSQVNFQAMGNGASQSTRSGIDAFGVEPFVRTAADFGLRPPYLGGVAVEEASTLVPGNGWTSPVMNPAPIGQGPMAIAAFTVIPHQMITVAKAIGVVANHMDGIDRVSFSLENGPWVDVYRQSYDSEARVYNYNVRLDAIASFSAPRQIEIRANVYPIAGQPRQISLTLVVNPNAVYQSIASYVGVNGSNNPATCGINATNPCDTIRTAVQALGMRSPLGTADAHIIYLLAGNHAWNTNQGLQPPATGSWNPFTYLTITRAPGLSKSQVTINSSLGTGLGVDKVHLKGVTVRTALFGRPSSNYSDKLWVDDCDMIGSGPLTSVGNSGWFEGFKGIFISNTTIRNDKDCFVAGSEVRETVVYGLACEDIGQSAFWAVPSGGIVFNSKINRLTTLGTPTFHPDFLYWNYRLGVTFENITILNVVGTLMNAQFLFIKDIGGVKDLALINVHASPTEDSVGSSPIVSPVDHLVARFVTWVQNISFSTPNLQNISIKDSIIERVSAATPAIDSILHNQDFSNNHYINSIMPNIQNTVTPLPPGVPTPGTPIAGAAVYGTNATVGMPQWVNSYQGPQTPLPYDFHLLPTSPAHGRVNEPSYPANADSEVRAIPADLGAY